MSDTIDIFCPNCLPAKLSEQAERNLDQRSPDWYLGMMLANIGVLAAQYRAAQDGSAPLKIKELANDPGEVPSSNGYQSAVTTTGAPVPLSQSSLPVQSVEILARKSAATANTGNVFVGFSNQVGGNLRTLSPGQSLTFSAPTGTFIDLSTIYIEAATSGDGVIYTAIA